MTNNQNEELIIFDSNDFINNYSNHFRFKNDGIEISYLDLANTNFILNTDFINQCRKAVNEERKSLSLPNLQEEDSVLKKYGKIDIVFKNCKFTDFTVTGQIIKDNVFIEFDINDEEIKNLQMNFMRISASKFYGKFYINKQYDGYKEIFNIYKLVIEDSNFNDNFKLHNCKIRELKIKNVDFEKNADFYKSIFIKGINTNDIYFKSINFKSLALFGDTEFLQKLIFKYVTFEGHNHFKSAKLHKGLDLEYTNVQKEINFYGIEILDKNTTSQETYRIIKNQFEKLNNKIEANKYHALELDQRKKELGKNKWKNLSEFLVFKIHDISSKHSTSYFRSVLGIIFIGFFTIFLVHYDIAKDLFFHPSNFKIEYLSKIWNEFWQYVNITNLEKLKANPFILFINKVSLGYLYYQFLTAVRKDTRK